MQDSDFVQQSLVPRASMLRCIDVRTNLAVLHRFENVQVLIDRKITGERDGFAQESAKSANLIPLQALPGNQTVAKMVAAL